MLKTLITFIFSFFIVNLGIARELIVISDLDDTLRMANVESIPRAAVRIIHGVKPFESMQLLLNDIKAQNPEAKFYYISNSLHLFYDAKKWIRNYNFPEGAVLQRPLRVSPKVFKPRELRKIAGIHGRDAQYILFGDNVEKDPEFYQDFLRELAINDAHVFIRDARLIFTQHGPQVSFYQHERQVLTHPSLSMISGPTKALIRAMDLSKLVPKYLFDNLKRRLARACYPGRNNRLCREEAAREVGEIAEDLAGAQ